MAFERLAILAPTTGGYALAQTLLDGFPQAIVWTKSSHLGAVVNPRVRGYDGDLATLVADVWPHQDALVFVLAAGAVVRLIAPLLGEKNADPGVVVVDQAATHVLSLTGGHGGGADDLTRQIAALLDAHPVITSASEGQQVPAVDCLGEPYGWRRGEGDWLGVAAALVRNDPAYPVRVTQTCGSELWRDTLPDRHSLSWTGESAAAEIWISDHRPPAVDHPLVSWHPRTLWVGLGCERGTTQACLDRALRQVLQTQNLAWQAIAGCASIDLKQDEIGLIALADQYAWPIRWFSAAELAIAPVPNPSAVVDAAVGTPSVAEAAAILAADAPLVVDKQIYRDEEGACTVAIARSTVDYNPHPGKLYLIGIGPGSLAQLTPAAKLALADCHTIIGYQLYVDLIHPLLHPSQRVETSPITQEKQRAERAIALANQGLTVGVVSSGDCGIYGMAGLVLECLAAQGWTGDRPSVEVLPGITALQAAAARIGAPLMHDFCAISLSDLLTPWEVIYKRLDAAAQADFVVALYNPRSQTRLQGIETAFELFRRYRPGDTPVAIARSVYRPDETIHLTTLADVDVTRIDMLTVVLIGNRSTFQQGNTLITPRGYQVRKTDGQ
jgi:cobalt-precorrin 5A hydrolase/precorrin-3B C17-methyltransferase